MARLWCLALVLLVLAGSAFAQEAETESEQVTTEVAAQNEPADLGIIEVRAEAITLSARALPGQSVTVLNRGEWSATARSIADVLEQAAPLTLARTGGEGNLATLSLRAAGSADTLVMLNGVPVALPGGTPVDLSLIDLSAIERIEIIPGAASLHGTRATGGIVNIVLRGDTSIETGATIELSAGSFGTFRGGVSRVRSSADSQETLIASVFTTRGNFYFETVNYLIRTRRNNDAQRVNLLWQRQEFSADSLRTSFASLHALRRGVPGFAEFPTEHARLTEEIFTAGISEFEPAPTAKWGREWSVALAQGFTRFRDDAPLLGAPVRSRTADGKLRGTLLLGRDESDGRSEVAFSLTGNAMSAADYGNPKRITGRVNALRCWRTGDFALTPSVALDLCEGERAEASWDLGVAWQPEGKLTVSANTGRSFRYPEFAELYYPSQGFMRGNPNLESEHADYANMGFALRGERGELTADTFWREQHDTIRFLPVSAQCIRPVNTGETRARGLEASARLRLSERMTVSASYALTDAEYSRSGIDFTQTPRHRFHGAVAYDDGCWSAEVSHFRESQQSADLFGSIRVPGKALWNLSLARQTRGERCGKLKVTVRNVFDQSARDFWDLPLPGRSVEVSWERTF